MSGAVKSLIILPARAPKPVAAPVPDQTRTRRESPDGPAHTPSLGCCIEMRKLNHDDGFSKCQAERSPLSTEVGRQGR